MVGVENLFLQFSLQFDIIYIYVFQANSAAASMHIFCTPIPAPLSAPLQTQEARRYRKVSGGINDSVRNEIWQTIGRRFIQRVMWA